MSSISPSVVRISSPREQYEADLARGVIMPDAAQAAAIAALELRHAALVARWRAQPSWWQCLFGGGRAAPIRGLYLWGGVGRGKTYLMDMFFQTLPGQRKLRMHFHRFMLMVQQRLKEQSGHSDPLVRVAQSIAAESDVLCFDEFFVSDIGDAMILANLLEALLAADVVLIATSNIVPARLYERGLQRQNFLPAIALLEQYTEVLNVDGGVDYRLRSLDKVPVYRYPLNADSAAALEALFGELTRGLHVERDSMLEVLQRRFRALRWSEGVVWFDFATLCGGPRAAADYLELARQYHSVFVSAVPVLGEHANDQARRFITLVDTLYDHRVKLVLSAADSLDRLYQGTVLAFAFERTRSRLLEMQTRDYLGASHRPG